MSAAKRLVTPRKGALLALTHAVAWLVLAAANSPSGRRSRWMRQKNQTHRSRRRCPRHVQLRPGGTRQLTCLRLQQFPLRQSRHRGLSETRSRAAEFAAGLPRPDARVRTGMAKDEGNGRSGGQNLVRFRPDLSGEMSLVHPRGPLSLTLHAASQSSPRAPRGFGPLAVKPFATMRPNETSCDSKRGQPATRENPLAQTRRPRAAAGRLHSSCEVVKRSPEGPAAAAAGGFAGGRFAHHLLGADLPCRGLPDHLFRRRLLGGSLLGRGLLHRPFLGHCLARGFFDSALFYRGLLRGTLLRRGFPCWLFGGCLHHVQSSSAVFSRLIRNAD